MIDQHYLEYWSIESDLGNFIANITSRNFEPKRFVSRAELIEHGLEQNGYSGFCIVDYSPYEFKCLNDFRKKTDTKFLRFAKETAVCGSIGSYTALSFNLWTKEPNDFDALMKTIPARTEYELVKTKVQNHKFKNKKNIIGSDGILFSYALTDDPISILGYKSFLRLTN